MSDDDNSTGLELTRRRILGGIGTIGAASAAAGAGTFAYFSDTESSTGNTVTAGTLDLTPDGVSGFSFGVSEAAPGDDLAEPSVDLDNTGTVDGDHLEFAASITGDGGEPAEPSDSALDTEVSNEEFAKRVFVSSLTYDGNPVNWNGEAFATLVDHPGAVVIDDMTLNRVADPAGSGRGDVLQATGTGYGVSMRSGFSLELGNIETGDVTLDWYAGSDNSGSAPDEIFAVIEDDSGTRRLVYHTANYDPDNDTVDGETWRTLDIGQEMGVAGSGSDAYNASYHWHESAPDSSNTYPKPSNGGLTGSGTNASFGSTAEIKALGFGLGNFGKTVQKNTYYDNLTVGSDADLDLRPLTAYDLAKRGVADDLPGLTSSGGTKTFSADLDFDPAAGNDYQADGVTLAFEYGLAQESGQDVL